MTDTNNQGAQEEAQKHEVKKVAAFAKAAADQAESASIDLELKRLELAKAKAELEEKQLNIELAKANIVDAREKLQERDMKRENHAAKAKTNGQNLLQMNHENKVVQARCNHKKGGNGAAGVLLGQGDDSNYAILKHQFANGDWWVRCLRCGKKWSPPIEEMFKTKEAYLEAYVEYKAALLFQTRNSPSSSMVFNFSDKGEYYRKQMAYTELR